MCQIKLAEIKYYNLGLFKLGRKMKLRNRKLKKNKQILYEGNK